MQFNKPALKKLTLPEGKSDQVVFDDDLPGFGLRMRSGGKRTWIAQYRIGAKQRRLSLGSAKTIDLDEARKRAKIALSQVNLGVDPFPATVRASLAFTIERPTARRSARLSRCGESTSPISSPERTMSEAEDAAKAAARKADEAERARRAEAVRRARAAAVSVRGSGPGPDLTANQPVDRINFEKNKIELAVRLHAPF
jgi:Arm DNA-binding domain